LVDERIAIDQSPRELHSVWDLLLQRDYGNGDVGESRTNQGFLDRIDLVTREGHLVKLRRISGEEVSGDFMRNSTELVVGVRVPNIEQVPATGSEHAVNFTVGFILVWKKHHAELADNGVKAAVGEWEGRGIGRTEIHRFI
jgi:hypothetical protein